MTVEFDIETHTDAEGFLRQTADWSERIAEQLAQQSGLELDTARIRLVRSARQYYERYDQPPLARSFIRFCQQADPAYSSMSLMLLFPPSTESGSSIKQLCRIAGLPKPPGCL